MGDNKYLDELNSLGYKTLRRGVKEGKSRRLSQFSNPLSEDRGIYVDELNEVAKFGYALEVMKEAQSHGDVCAAISAYKIFDSIGRGSKPKVLSGLLKTLKIAIEDGKIYSNKQDEAVREIKKIIKERGGEATRTSSLEKRTALAFIGSILVGAFLIGSASITGNSIGSSGSTSMFGALIFIAGMVGGLIFARS